MQTELMEFMGQLMALGILVTVGYFAWTTKNPVTFSDTFVVGYVEESAPAVIHAPPIDTKLQQDCIDVLIKLGLSKRESKQKVKAEFNSGNPPKSIQECLKRIL